MFKVGDRVRVLVDDADGAEVDKGDEFFIKKVFMEDCGVEVESKYNWVFRFKNIELVENA